MVTARDPLIAIHSLLHDSPMPVIRDDESV
jgi:hypothetical protein